MNSLNDGTVNLAARRQLFAMSLFIWRNDQDVVVTMNVIIATGARAKQQYTRIRQEKMYGLFDRIVYHFATHSTNIQKSLGAY